MKKWFGVWVLSLRFQIDQENQINPHLCTQNNKIIGIGVDLALKDCPHGL